MVDLDEAIRTALIETLARSQVLLRRLLDNTAVFRAISFETLSEIQAMCSRQQQLLERLREGS